MKKKMPQSHPTHVNDKRARRNLEDVFPEHWKLSKLEDFHSGIEYGDDWLCEVTDEANTLTGARFYIQSKATEKRLDKRARRLGMPFKVSTLNRLHKLNLPVILHYFHVPSKTGFWMWLDEYYLREYRPEWEERDRKIDVYIPTKNTLDEASVKQIMAGVLKFHRLHHLQKQVETANKVDPNYGFRFEVGHEYVGIGMYPKHPNALVNQPIEVTLAVDPSSNEKIRHSTELGIPAHFEANAVFEGLPKWLVEDTDAHGKVIISLFPLVDEKPSHLQFEYLDADDTPIFKSKLVEMALVQPGTKYKLYEGNSQTEPLIFTVTFDAIKPQTSFTVSYNHENRSIEALDWYYDLLENLTRTVNARIHNLDTGQSHLLENYNAFKRTGEFSPPMRQFIKNLAVISRRMKRNLLMPEKPQLVSYDDALLAQAVVEVINTGITYKLTPIPKETREGDGKLALFGKTTRIEARRIITGLEDGGQVYIHVPTETALTILDYSFDLGPARYFSCCTEILNLDELQENLTVESIDETKEVELRLAVDLARSYMEFQNWLPDMDQGK